MHFLHEAVLSDCKTNLHLNVLPAQHPYLRAKIPNVYLPLHSATFVSIIFFSLIFQALLCSLPYVQTVSKNIHIFVLHFCFIYFLFTQCNFSYLDSITLSISSFSSLLAGSWRLCSLFLIAIIVAIIALLLQYSNSITVQTSVYTGL